GTAVADMIAENGLGTRLIKIGVPGYTHGASKMYLMKKYGIDAMSLVHAVEKLSGKELGITEDFLEEERFVDFLEV
ncbi:MAG: transketolase, partial [Parasporobacterium sp.]|nr:transketolase [Parasporobacterium sp.]